MKTEPSTAGRSLRAVSLSITVLSVLVFSTLTYSAYEDAAGVLKIFGNASTASGVTVSSTVQGSTSRVVVNITLQNNGFYPVAFAGSCVNTPGGLNGTCSLPSTTVAPGQTSTVQLAIFVTGLSPQNGTGGKPLNADFTVALKPFVSLNVTANLAELIGEGGG